MGLSDISLIENEKQRHAIFELRKAGWSHAQIADQLNLTRHHIAQVLKKELEAVRNLADAALDDLRALELARLDEATRSIWPRVLSADTRAIDIFLKISERRARLTGLDAPERTLTIDLSTQLQNYSPVELIQEATRLGLPLPPPNLLPDTIPLPGEVSGFAFPAAVPSSPAFGGAPGDLALQPHKELPGDVVPAPQEEPHGHPNSQDNS